MIFKGGLASGNRRRKSVREKCARKKSRLENRDDRNPWYAVTSFYLLTPLLPSNHLLERSFDIREAEAILPAA